jgi:hypothetical protein
MSYPHFSSQCDEHHAVVKDMHGVRPKIVTLCGSTRFKAEFEAVMKDLTLQGAIVISVGLFGHSGDLPSDFEGSDTKLGLDELHKRKIDLADEIFVINPGGYIGSSTRSEIEYAERHGKPVRTLIEELGAAVQAEVSR